MSQKSWKSKVFRDNPYLKKSAIRAYVMRATKDIEQSYLITDTLYFLMNQIEENSRILKKLSEAVAWHQQLLEIFVTIRSIS